MSDMSPIHTDRTLRDDIRLLGRILGDTVRAQEGEAVFETVERIRQTSIRFHHNEDEAARGELATILNALSPGSTIQIIRAFSYFSHLANIAEDLHRIRRTRAHAHAGSPPRDGTMAAAFARTRAAGVPRQAIQDFFDRAAIRPVLTAHPTEIRRKSTIDREMEAAALLSARDRVRLTPDEEVCLEEDLRRAILILWQTTLVRRHRLKVIDEVVNGLSYYDYTFLRELPRFYADLEDSLVASDQAWKGVELPSFFRMGSWIGGDRDGNPFVTADVLHQTLRLQSGKALSFYLDELHALGGELSLDAGRVSVSEDVRKLAESSPDRSTHREREPYRRAIAGLYARLATTAKALGHSELPRHAVGDAPPYSRPAEFLKDLAAIRRSLQANGSGAVARGRLRRLCRAVDVFGFHLAELDLRQNSDVHERTIAELVETAEPGKTYASLSEDKRVELLLAELRTVRPLASPHIEYSDGTASELAILREVARRTAASTRTRSPTT